MIEVQRSKLQGNAEAAHFMPALPLLGEGHCFLERCRYVTDVALMSRYLQVCRCCLRTQRISISALEVFPLFQCSGIRNEQENSVPLLYKQFWSRNKQAPFKRSTSIMEQEEITLFLAIILTFYGHIPNYSSLVLFFPPLLLCCLWVMKTR